MLWTDKYAPKKMDAVVGNPEALERMKVWALEWDRGSRKPPLFVYGPPGCGKTCAAHAIANTYGWEILEMNASDIRDKGRIGDIIGTASSNSTLSGALKLVLVDEVDGAVERGGVSAIYEITKGALQPMIIVANDAWDPPLSPLRTACTLVEMRRVNVRSVFSRLREISHSENLSVGEEKLEAIAENSRGDLRSAINDLQSLGGFADAEIFERDREKNIFDSVRKVFKGKTYDEGKEALRGLEVEPDMFARWIDENVPREYENPEDVARAFDSLSRADVFFGRIRNRQYWGFLRYVNDLTTAGVSLAKKEPYHKFTKYSFPEVIKKLSASKGKRAKEKKILEKIGARCHSSVKRSREFFPLVKLMFKKAQDATTITSYFGFDEEDLLYFGIGKEKKKIEKPKGKEKKKTEAKEK
jgi:replication factor C large subunit